MCGRFTQAYTWAEVHAFLDVIGPPRNLRPRYNIAPTTQIDVLRPRKEGRELVSMRWGLVPVWWKKPLNELPSTFNARAETVAEKPMFRSAFKS
jgi:putative SOS response-associated peptidase YedK